MTEAIENYRKTYEKLLPEINADIEKYRKGNFKIKVLKKDGTPVKATVKAEQKSHKFDFGINVLMIGYMGEKEQEYRDAISNMFNLVTTTFCWDSMEIEKGNYRFEEGSEEIYRRPPADRVLKFAQKSGIKSKGQPLFSDSWYPNWASMDADVLREQWFDYVQKVAERYDGKYYLFDVVNESYLVKHRTPDHPWLAEDPFNYVKWTLKKAGEVFSKNCIMERNEATHVNYGEYAEKYYNENNELLDEGIRLDSIGFQFHFFSGKNCIDEHISGEASLENIYNAYKKMSTLGIPMYISEITIPSVYENMSLEEGEELQAEILEKLYRLWFSIPNMQGVIYWNLKDGDTWKNESECLGCLIDSYMRKKKSYYTIEHLIKREWNTCITSETDINGVLEFSGFYGNYDITVDAEDLSTKKCEVSFDKESEALIIHI